MNHGSNYARFICDIRYYGIETSQGVTEAWNNHGKLVRTRQWRIKGGGSEGGRPPPQEQDELGNLRCLKEVKEEETTKQVKKMKKNWHAT